ncbi:selenium metabolism protein YedF [Halobacteroides halobius DSM 5150]|uniref:Selenium metabolism protein YedF n=1 Tax=Halobacteroides halobius (strain ATCC 35273 / DSM 5150 / MD-1) TaxID=748449 RepID=L0KD98_HALHC|nr:sulfurtransferase-like selenium metabolism protein YedF [Halobacteroides halobius]AGB42068.1 selenium metabolism protein YedF [Halobacteroides halobius DSM 5150]
MKELNARGLDCPKPVVKTKQALEEEDKVIVTVDDQVQAENVAKLAKKMNCKVSTLEEENYYKLTIEKLADETTEDKEDSQGKVYFITSATLGEGAEELGNVLMKGFISTLLNVTPVPNKIIFINSGVKVPTLNQEAKEHLKELEAKGVTILSCGTCLDYYGLEEKLEIGNISNMYEILDSLNSNGVVKV